MLPFPLTHPFSFMWRTPIVSEHGSATLWPPSQSEAGARGEEEEATGPADAAAAAVAALDAAAAMTAQVTPALGGGGGDDSYDSDDWL